MTEREVCWGCFFECVDADAWIVAVEGEGVVEIGEGALFELLFADGCADVAVRWMEPCSPECNEIAGCLSDGVNVFIVRFARFATQ